MRVGSYDIVKTLKELKFQSSQPARVGSGYRIMRVHGSMVSIIPTREGWVIMEGVQMLNIEEFQSSQPARAGSKIPAIALAARQVSIIQPVMAGLRY